MKTNFLFVTMLTLGFIISPGVKNMATGQAHFCSTHGNHEDPLLKLRSAASKTSSTPHGYVVRIFIHFIRRSNGTGGESINDVPNMLQILEDDFSQHNICFDLVGVDEILDDDLYNHACIGTLGCPNFFVDLQGVSFNTDAIDIYVMGPDNPLFGGGAAQEIPSTQMTYGNTPSIPDNIFLSSVLSHEMGHCLGLYHTYRGTCQLGGSGPTPCAENPNGSNCTTCGDLVCDTDADPSQAADVNTGTCNWDGTLCANAPAGTYTPSKTNIMSAAPISCYQSFTNGQGERMRDMLDLSSVLIPVREELTDQAITIVNEVYNSPDDEIFATTANISISNTEVNNGARLRTFAGGTITIDANFEVNSGGDYHAKIVSCDFSQKRSEIEEILSSAGIPTHFGTKASINIFPNPNTSQFNLDIKLGEARVLMLDIFNPLGQCVLSREYNANGTYQLNLENKPGVYIAKVKVGELEFSKKIVVTE